MNALVSHRKDRRIRFCLMVEGAATITLDQKVHRPNRSDVVELRKDWEKIGNDLRKTMTKAKRDRANV